MPIYVAMYSSAGLYVCVCVKMPALRLLLCLRKKNPRLTRFFSSTGSTEHFNGVFQISYMFFELKWEFKALMCDNLEGETVLSVRVLNLHIGLASICIALYDVFFCFWPF